MPAQEYEVTIMKLTEYVLKIKAPDERTAAKLGEMEVDAGRVQPIGSQTHNAFAFPTERDQKGKKK